MNCVRTRRRYTYVDSKTTFLYVGVRSMAQCQCATPELIPLDDISLHIKRKGLEDADELVYAATSRTTSGAVAFRVDSQLHNLLPGIYDAEVHVDNAIAKNVMEIVVKNKFVSNGMYSDRQG